jgi:hypothetical protein
MLVKKRATSNLYSGKGTHASPPATQGKERHGDTEAHKARRKKFTVYPALSGKPLNAEP